MAADEHIHVAEGVPEEHVRMFLQSRFSLGGGGSKQIKHGYREFKINGVWIHEDEFFTDKYESSDAEDTRTIILPISEKEYWEVLEKTPNCWIGEVSWLKANLFGDSQTFIPDTVLTVSDLFQEMPTITEELIEAVREAFALPNNTKNEHGEYRLASVNDVVEFLAKHKGRKAFTVAH